MCIFRHTKELQPQRCDSHIFSLGLAKKNMRVGIQRRGYCRPRCRPNTNILCIYLSLLLKFTHLACNQNILH